jgi:hypothetical protein
MDNLYITQLILELRDRLDKEGTSKSPGRRCEEEDIPKIPLYKRLALLIRQLMQEDPLLIKIKDHLRGI